MRIGLFSLIAAAAFLGVPGIVCAQNAAKDPAIVCNITEEISAGCLKEFNDWVKEEVKYRKWIEANFNRPAHSGWDWSPVSERKDRPTPPAWVVNYCEGTFLSDVTSDQICPRFNALKDYDWVSEHNQKLLAQLRMREEKPYHSTFMQRIHFDALYTAAEFPSPHIYGAIGIHVGLIPLGRCQINVIPGTLLISRPDQSGGRQWQPAVTVGGGSCALSKFTFPGTQKRALLHANVVRVHVMGETSEAVLLHSGADLTLMGLSITLR